MRILISEKNSCAYTWDYVNSKLLYAPLLDNNTFNTFEFVDITDFDRRDADEIYRIKKILINDYRRVKK
jgi:hypothetical protein